MDIYLNAVDQETMYDALIITELLQPFGDVYVPAPGVNIDEIGIISTVDPETEVVTTVPGWHVNLRVSFLTEEQQELLEPYIITPPNTPYRVWF